MNHSFSYPQRFQSDDFLDGRLEPKTSKRRFAYPQALITENLSEDNPFHVRKRFNHSKGRSFTFDEDGCSRPEDLVPADILSKTSRPGTLGILTDVQLENDDTIPSKLHRSFSSDKENSKNRDTLMDNSRSKLGESALDRGLMILGERLPTGVDC